MRKLTEFQSVRLWILKSCGSKQTEIGYVHRLEKFCHFYRVSPDQIIEKWRSVRYDYLKREKFIDEWTENLENYYALSEGTPLSKVTTAMTILSFFKHNKIPIELRINKKGLYVKYPNKDISRELIERIVNNSRLREKVFYLMMVESLLRPNTLVQLWYGLIKEDFEKNQIPMKIELPPELLKDKVGKRFSFIGEDGFKALKEYLAPRLPLKDSDFIFAPQRAIKGIRMGAETFSNKFHRTVAKLKISNISEKDKPKPLRLYCLRKYSRNNIRVSDTAFREFWMGHTFGTDEHYLTRDPEKHRKEYAKAYESIRNYKPIISQSIEELKDHFEQRLKETTKKIESMKERVQQLEQIVRVTHNYAEVLEEPLRPKQAKTYSKKKAETQKVLEDFLKKQGYISLGHFAHQAITEKLERDYSSQKKKGKLK